MRKPTNHPHHIRGSTSLRVSEASFFCWLVRSVARLPAVKEVDEEGVALVDRPPVGLALEWIDPAEVFVVVPDATDAWARLTTDEPGISVLFRRDRRGADVSAKRIVFDQLLGAGNRGEDWAAEQVLPQNDRFHWLHSLELPACANVRRSALRPAVIAAESQEGEASQSQE